MKTKILKGDMGFCPRVMCHKQPVIPYGESNDPKTECETLVYCPLCKGLFQPDYLKHQKVNGAHFGPYFAATFLLCYPKIVKNIGPEKHEHRIYGFKISELSPIYQ